MKLKFMLWLCSKLPKTLVYYCANNLVAYATTGNYSNTVVPELSAMDALKRYGNDHKCY
jgi:hypothetical protein